MPSCSESVTLAEPATPVLPMIVKVPFATTQAVKFEVSSTNDAPGRKPNLLYVPGLPTRQLIDDGTALRGESLALFQARVPPPELKNRS